MLNVREKKDIEFKRQFVDSIKNTVIAFANTDGGTLYVGVDDHGNVVGVDDLDDTLTRITNTLRDTIRPDIMMFVDCTPECVEGKTIIRITVQKGSSAPYYLAGKGIHPNGVFVRQGASTVPASQELILKMIRHTGVNTYESTRCLEQNLTFNATKKFFEDQSLSFGPAQMQTLHLTSDGAYTNLALLLSDQCPFSIKIAVFEGRTPAIFKNRIEITGSVLEQAQQAIEFLDRYNATHAIIGKLKRIETRDYPPEALREAVLNAIVHRDYALSAATLIYVYTDRIEIASAGGAVPGFSFTEMMQGYSSLRNNNLGNIFYRLGLIEAYGTGIPRIMGAYENSNHRPKIDAGVTIFRVTLPNLNFQEEKKPKENDVVSKQSSLLTDRLKKIEDQYGHEQYFDRKDLEKLFGLSTPTVIGLLRKLRDQELIENVRRGKQYLYRVKI